MTTVSVFRTGTRRNVELLLLLFAVALVLIAYLNVGLATTGQVPVDIVPAGQVPAGMRHVFDGLDAHDRPVALVHEDSLALRRMAVFDAIVNNADRKGGHVLAMVGGHRYGVDHGLTFHTDPKLRTVLWGWLGEPFNADEVAGLRRVRTGLDGELGATLRDLLAPEEIEALAQRLADLLERGTFPEPPHTSYPVIPWPPF